MRNVFLVMTWGVLLLVSACKGYDDSDLWNEVNSLDTRLDVLEGRCEQMNQNLLAVQMIVTALQQKESITSVSSLPDGSGYLIILSSGKEIRINHGQNGENGKNGSDGKDGIDGCSPKISVRQDVDGEWYWTIDGDWLYSDKNKVKASAKDGIDGKNGTNGNDGITPKFKIEGGDWHISYDDGVSWINLGPATGENGLNGENGDSFFSGVVVREGYVAFYLNDEDRTELKLPFVTEKEYSIHLDTAGTIAQKIPLDICRTITVLKVSGPIINSDITQILIRFTSLEELDLSDATISIDGKMNSNGIPNLSITKVYLPYNSQHYDSPSFAPEINLNAFYAIRDIVASPSNAILRVAVSDGAAVENLVIPEGVKEIRINKPIENVGNMILPGSLEMIEFSFAANSLGSEINSRFIVIKALTPPELKSNVTNTDRIKVSEAILVPKSAIEVYKQSKWGALADVRAMEDYSF